MSAEWRNLEEAPDSDEGVQEGFPKEMTFGSLIRFDGVLEVWPRHWGSLRNLVKFSVYGTKCVCMCGRERGVRDLGDSGRA